MSVMGSLVTTASQDVGVTSRMKDSIVTTFCLTPCTPDVPEMIHMGVDLQELQVDAVSCAFHHLLGLAPKTEPHDAPGPSQLGLRDLRPHLPRGVGEHHLGGRGPTVGPTVGPFGRQGRLLHGLDPEELELPVGELGVRVLELVRHRTQGGVGFHGISVASGPAGRGRKRRRAFDHDWQQRKASTQK